MNNILEFDQCSNCGACVNSCPKDAISVASEGLFYELKVDGQKCVNCGICKTVCPVAHIQPAEKIRSAWWGRCKNAEMVQKSSSGGGFSALADYILANGGVVFGAAYDADCRTVRIQSTETVSLDALRRSKYVESLVGDSFRRVQEKLTQGIPVLYCATPCQIAGLKAFLKKDDPNLYTCDFACGGLSSHKLYQAHLDALEKKYGSEVTDVNFRPKIYGWSIHGLRVRFRNGKTYQNPGVIDSYLCGFIREHVNARDYCYHCDFAEHHASDIILADFWKHDQLTGKKHDQKGLSLILVNSEKGGFLLNQARKAMDLHEIDREAAGYNLKKACYDEEYMKLRDRYLKACEEQGLEQAARVVRRPEGRKAAVLKAKCVLKGLLSKLR